MKIAWAEITTLKTWPLPSNIWGVGPANSNLMIILKPVPTKPENIAKIIYNIAISLQLVENNHLFIYCLRLLLITW